METTRFARPPKIFFGIRTPEPGTVTTLIALAILATVSPLGAQSDPLLEEWRWHRFTAESGAPTARVSLITSATTGIVWVSTTQELLWFDGFRWHRPEGAPAPRVERLEPDTEGGILVVGGGRMWRGNEDGLSEVVLEFDGQPLAIQQAAAFGTAGELLVLAATGLFRLEDGRLTRFPEPVGRDVLSEGVLHRTESGTIWYLSSTTSGGSFTWTGDEWVGRHPYLSNWVYESEQGGLLAVNQATEVNGLWSWGPSDPEPRRLSGEDAALVMAMAGSDETVVAAYRSGRVGVRRAGVWSSLTTVPRDLENAHELHFDAQGDLWAATDGGLSLFKSSSTRWTRRSYDGLPLANEVNALALTPGGDVWLGTADGLVVRRVGGPAESIREIQGQALGVVTSVTHGPDGSIWVSSGADWDGVFRLRDGVWERLGEAQGLPAGRVHRTVVDRQDRVWFLGLSPLPRVDEPGAAVLDSGRITRWGEEEGLPSGRVYAFAEGPDGSLWFGTAVGLSRWAAGAWTHWTLSSGLTRPRVYTVTVAGGRTWFAHAQLAGGLGYVGPDDEVTYLTEADGLVDSRVWELQAGPDGALWLGTAGGLARYADGRFATFDRDTGLEHPRVWPVLPTSDRVYAGTIGGGLYELDLEERSTPGPIVELGTPLVTEDRLFVEWTALAFRGQIAPEAIETRFRADGEDWSRWSRVREIELSVSPGEHVVEVEAKGLFGDISRAPATASFQVPPPLYRHPLVIAFALLWVGTGLALGAWYWRRRRHQASAVEASEQRLRALIEQMPICIHEVSLDGTVLSMNPAGLTMLGLEHEEHVVGSPMLAAVAEEDRDRVSELLDRARAGEAVEFQFLAQRPDGETRVFASSIAPLRDEQCEVVKLMGYTRDLTAQTRAEEERLRLEDALRQAQKMEAVGQLAGGVAHDFNNLLTIIGGYASMIASGGSDDPDALRTNVQQILEAHDRAGSLTRQLLAFGRRQTLEARVIEIAESIRALEGMLRRLISAELSLVFAIEKDVGLVRVDPAGIEQVVINLVVNARDAVEPGGEIRISVFDSTLDVPHHTPAGTLEAGEYVVIQVADDGAGMDPEVQARALEPFFTTKPAGRGTGLGLSTAYGIVAQSGGLLQIDSELGRGTRMSVYLPRFAGARAVERRKSPRSERYLDGSETILVAEDNDGVRDLVAATLRRYGYKVLTATNGVEGVRVATEHPEPVHALVTDLIMPELNGRDLAERFREARPDAVVLFMSGYAHESVLGSGPHPVVDLQKPFPPVELARKLRNRLDQRKRDAG